MFDRWNPKYHENTVEDPSPHTALDDHYSDEVGYEAYLRMGGPRWGGFFEVVQTASRENGQPLDLGASVRCGSSAKPRSQQLG